MGTLERSISKCQWLWLMILFCTVNSLVIPDLELNATESENDNIFKRANSWLPWKEQQKALDSIVVPIVSSASRNIFGGVRTSSSEDASMLQKTSSALLNFAGDGYNQIKNSSMVHDMSTFIEERLPDNVKTNMEATGIIIGNTMSGLGDIAFPEGENTSLIEGVSNVVNELKATGKELEKWPIQELIVSSVNEQASKLFGFTSQSAPTEKAAAVIGIERDAEIMGGENFETDDDSSSSNSRGGILSKKAGMIIVIVIASVSVISLIINIVLTTCLVQQKKEFKRMHKLVKSLPDKEQRYLHEQQITLLHTEDQQTPV